MQGQSYMPPSQAGQGPSNYGQSQQPQQPQPAQGQYYAPPTQYGNPTQNIGQAGGQGSQYPQYTPPQQYQPQTQNFAQPAQGYSNYPQQQGTYQYAPAAVAPKDPTVALLLELIGFLGFLGIGHMYAGKVPRGIALMFGYWVYMTMSVILIFLLIGCLLLPIGFVFPILSGLWIKSEMEKERAMGITQY
jgi:TM2 domain-containing membrane protein YozV